MKTIAHNVQGEALTLVNSTNTAIAAESGSLPVFGSPYMIALMEKATCEAAEELLDEGETTVGTAMNIIHCRASVIGDVITANATLTETDGRKLVFDVVAKDNTGQQIGSGTIERFVVNTEKFLRKAENK